MQLEQKVQGVSSYYLIAVHEEADDECAHAQLNSRHNPPTIQRYIPNNVQRNDSSSSEDGVMGGSLD
jgi:hypothetical protein